MTVFEGSGTDLRAAREARGLSRRELAARCGYPSQTRIFNIETKDSWKDGDRERLGEVLAGIPEGAHQRGAARVDALEQKLRANGHLLRSEPLELAEPHDYSVEVFSPPSEDEDDELLELPEWFPRTEPTQAPSPGALAGLGGPEGHDEASVTTLTRWGQPHPLTNSEVAAWLRCRRKWWLSWYRGLVPLHHDPGGARESGGRVHRALAAWYVPDGLTPRDPREALEDAISEDWAQLEAEVRQSNVADPTEVLDGLARSFTEAIELERAIVEGYLQWLEETGADVQLEVTDSEMTVSATIEGPVAGEHVRVQLLGRLDVRGTRTSDGARLFLDHKNVPNFATPQKTLHMDPQMLHYMLLEAVTEDDDDRPFCHTALYNMLRKVKRSASAKPPFYQRVEIHHSPVEVESYRKRLLGVARDLHRVTTELDAGADPLTVVYPTPRNECSWDCDHFATCPMFDDGSRVEDAIAGLFRAEDPLTRYAVDLPQE